MAIKFSDLLESVANKVEDKLPRILYKDKRTSRSFDWFMKRAKGLRTEASHITDIKPAQVLKDRSLLINTDKFPITTKDDARTMIGRMLMFNYDPKHKDTLPYYDIYPLIFPIRLDAKGFLGINLHYLPLDMRARLMDALYTLLNTKTIKENTRIKLSYDILNSSSRFSYFKPCVKQYLYTHVKSRFLMVDPSDWDTVLFLPLAQWKKSDQQTVWHDLRNKIARP